MWGRQVCFLFLMSLIFLFPAQQDMECAYSWMPPSIFPGSLLWYIYVWTEGRNIKSLIQLLTTCLGLKERIKFCSTSQLNCIGELGVTPENSLFLSLSFPSHAFEGHHFSGSLCERSGYSIKLCVKPFQWPSKAMQRFITHGKGAASACSSFKPLKGLRSKLRGGNRLLLSEKETLPLIVSWDLFKHECRLEEFLTKMLPS